jgi:hypothetical protein
MMTTNSFNMEECICRGPQSELERLYMGEYLRSKGYSWEDLHKLPPEEEKIIMTEACTYTSLKLAELDARAQFVQEIHTPF